MDEENNGLDITVEGKTNVVTRILKERIETSIKDLVLKHGFDT